MTRVTFGVAVCLSQRKMSVALMIETYDLPFRLGMAVFTFLSESALVHIVLLVTTGTHLGRIVMKCRAPMAITASHRTMTGPQGKSGF